MGECVCTLHHQVTVEIKVGTWCLGSPSYSSGSSQVFVLFSSPVKWDGHPEVKEMIELQQQGLLRSRGSGGHLVVPSNNLGQGEGEEEGDNEEEGGWESGDEGQWSSEGERGGKEGEGGQQQTS